MDMYDLSLLISVLTNTDTGLLEMWSTLAFDNITQLFLHLKTKTSQVLENVFPSISCRFSKAGIEDNDSLLHTGAELWTADTNELLCIMGRQGMELDTSAVGGGGGSCQLCWSG